MASILAEIYVLSIFLHADSADRHVSVASDVPSNTKRVNNAEY